ncbi:signal transduction histidine kinase, nitrogen specific, NtrB [Thermovibrio ammonificans HB-1]|uniref:histidine kinase n=1 Tax=Thermovibrio ammonificans (strain DSM 15698 / JCM 12110 / HB-1) TaxID=648996 RepID=E8T2H3_THEA1|nr:ATP-binding protein [Thermovibrio ammonificans]ADU97068.1 signal transduction histidine kinase, nitrogen specific, NtrB [Thermovibrio ammonificans HB-1]
MEAEDLLFSLPFPTLLVNGEGKVEKVNQKLEFLLNKSEKFLRGKSLTELFDEGYKLQKQAERSYTEEIEVVGFPFKEFFVHFSPLFVSSRKKGVVVQFEPRPENPFSVDPKLLLRGLSHELRNPLGGIKGAAKLFMELKSYDEELAQVIVEEVERIERLLNDISKGFDFSRPTFKRENIHKLIQKTLDLFKGELLSKNIEVNCLFDPSLPEIPLDPDKIQQALVNLIKNAIEAVERSERRVITVETGYAIRPADFIFIKVKDTGKGMSPNELKNYGQPFFSSKEEGTGLGTFIVNEIVKGHGGQLKVKSEPGVGTEVTLLIPMKRRDGENPRSR